jgi:hypothetical protein
MKAVMAAVDRQTAHERRGATDRGEYRQAAGAIAQLRCRRRSVALVGNRKLGRRLSFTMMVHGGHWGAPSVMAAFAGFVHDGQSAAR